MEAECSLLSPGRAAIRGGAVAARGGAFFYFVLKSYAPTGALEAPTATVKDGFSRKGNDFSAKGLF